ncbi:N-formylglutamate amidohydrolase [Telmatospirillum sp. J64-1]|uniref:N-formylglutamate amidohydrolase n=1 Tax=Telmatospirillum sp. J64-1 TaxID=2502183 RepID=UPI00115DA9CF|nr:N-formylglutamate amidohydrolase [Telmatospirillum sp. J64-1]
MTKLSPSSSYPTLLGPDEAPAVSVFNEQASTPLLLICDHASNAIPRKLGTLGLDREVLDRHVGYDIGAAAVTRGLAERLDCIAIMTNYSRLVIDCNRQPGDPTSIPEISDGIAVPGNLGLDADAAAERVATFFTPYHDTITQAIARLWHHHSAAPALMSVHSFTPMLMDCQPRPWHIGVLWNRDPRIAVPMLRALNGYADLCVGDNEPYSGRQMGYSVDTHAGAAGLPHVSVEIRQDLISDEAGTKRWAELLAEVLGPILAEPGLHRAQLY